MGVTRETLVHYNNLHKKHLDFSKKIKIMELGAQTVHYEDTPFTSAMFSSLGIDPAICNTFRYNMSSRDMHTKMGHDYDCIDLDTLDEDALLWDLNTVTCPSKMAGTYNLVTNHGTTEHLMGQVNAFKLMHDLTADNGIMLHILPCVEPNHGFFSYSPALFESLAAANNYEVCGRFLSELMNQLTLKQLYQYNGTVTFAPCYLHYALKKTSNAEFILPTQIFSNGVKQ